MKLNLISGIMFQHSKTIYNKKDILRNMKYILRNKKDFLRNMKYILRNKKYILGNMKYILCNKKGILCNMRDVLRNMKGILRNKKQGLHNMNDLLRNESIKISTLLLPLPVCQEFFLPLYSLPQYHVYGNLLLIPGQPR